MAAFGDLDGGMKVRLVDDHSLITDAVSALLHDMDADVEIHTAASAPEAMKLVEQHPDADLLLLDLGVPGATGTSLLETIVGLVPDLKILVLSVGQDQRSVMSTLQLGAAGFVPKSMATDKLVSAIKFVMSGGFYIPADLLEEAQRLGPLSGPPPRVQNATAGSGRGPLTARQGQGTQLPSRRAASTVLCSAPAF